MRLRSPIQFKHSANHPRQSSLDLPRLSAMDRCLQSRSNAPNMSCKCLPRCKRRAFELVHLVKPRVTISTLMSNTSCQERLGQPSVDPGSRMVKPMAPFWLYTLDRGYTGFMPWKDPSSRTTSILTKRIIVSNISAMAFLRGRWGVLMIRGSSSIQNQSIFTTRARGGDKTRFTIERISISIYMNQGVRYCAFLVRGPFLSETLKC